MIALDFDRPEMKTRDVFAAVSFRMRGIRLGDVKRDATGWEWVDLDLASPIVASQGTLSTEIVAAFVDDPHRRPRGIARDPDPILVRVDGRVFVVDGHHRLTAAMIRGDETLRCWVGNLGRSPP